MTKYKSVITTQEIKRNDTIRSDCNTISFYNIGGTFCTVLNIPIAPGGFLSFENSHPEITDVTEYKIKFDTDLDTNKILVFKKIIKKNCDI